MYRTRGKEIVLISTESDYEGLPYIGIELGDDTTSYYTSSGYYHGPSNPCSLDLVEHLGNITDLPAVKALTSTPDAK